MHVNWVLKHDERAAGNYLGYSTANQQLFNALKGLGVSHDDDANVAVHFMYPDGFQPVAGAKNVLFTMFEGIELPILTTTFAISFAEADLIVVPSEFCRRLFSHFTDTPIEVCPLGVDLQNFPYKRRRWRAEDGKPFVLGYVGAPNRRKFTILDQIAEQLLFPLEGLVHLYIKTTGAPEAQAQAAWTWKSFSPNVTETPEGRIYHGPLATVDTRKLPRTRLASEVYNRMQALFFCHAGEGWGMTGLEAMATGCPIIVSDWSGTQEYANRSNSFLVDVQMRDLQLSKIDGMSLNGSFDTYRCGYPIHESACDAIEKIISDYRYASKVAARGAEDARRFTWLRSARRMLEILRGSL